MYVAAFGSNAAYNSVLAECDGISEHGAHCAWQDSIPILASKNDIVGMTFYIAQHWLSADGAPDLQQVNER
jgi:hypothetical protein